MKESICTRNNELTDYVNVVSNSILQLKHFNWLANNMNVELQTKYARSFVFRTIVLEEQYNLACKNIKQIIGLKSNIEITPPENLQLNVTQISNNELFTNLQLLGS